MKASKITAILSLILWVIGIIITIWKLGWIVSLGFTFIAFGYLLSNEAIKRKDDEDKSDLQGE